MRTFGLAILLCAAACAKKPAVQAPAGPAAPAASEPAVPAGAAPAPAPAPAAKATDNPCSGGERK